MLETCPRMKDKEQTGQEVGKEDKNLPVRAGVFLRKPCDPWPLYLLQSCLSARLGALSWLVPCLPSDKFQGRMRVWG